MLSEKDNQANITKYTIAKPEVAHIFIYKAFLF